MVLRTLITIALLMSLANVFSQTDTVWINNEHDDIVITQYLQWFQATDDSLDWHDFKNVNINVSDQYPVEKDTITMPVNQLFWFRACVCNSTDGDLERFFFISHSSRVQLWQINNKGIKINNVFGSFINEQDLPIPGHCESAPISLPAKQCIRLIGSWKRIDRKFQKNYVRDFSVSIKVKEKMFSDDLIRSIGRTDYPMTVALLSVLAFLSIFMFLQYLQFKDKAYLAYTLYSGSFFIYYLFRRSHLFVFPFGYLREWNLLLEPYFALLPILLYIYFLRNFLFVTRNTHSRLHIATRYSFFYLIAIWLIFPILIHVYSISTASQFYYFSRNLFTFGAAYVIYLVYQQKNRLSTYFIVGTTALGFGGLMAALNEIVKTYSHNNTGEIINVELPYLSNTQLGILMESIIFAVALGYRNYLVKQQKEESERQLEITQDRLNRAQLSPHFVFNALNAIKHLMQTAKVKLAIKYLVQFASLLRYVLANLQKPNVPLSKELDLCRQYLNLEALRFSDAFNYHIQLDEHLDESHIFVPSMLLQPILENAIQHGLLPLKTKKGQILIQISSDKEASVIKISIQDNGIGRHAAAQNKKLSEHSSLGLQLSKDRVAQIAFNANLEIEDLYDDQEQASGTKVSIYFPIQ